MSMNKEEIKLVFDALQLLDLMPTPHNVSILNDVYEILRAGYNKPEEGAANAANTE